MPFRLSCLLLLAALCHAPEAQVTWEPIGFEGLYVSEIVTRPGPSNTDTLYVVNRFTQQGGLYRLEPDGTWTQIDGRSYDALEELGDGTFLTRANQLALGVSHDGARTWETVTAIDGQCRHTLNNVHESALPPPIGAVAGEPPAVYVATGSICRSDDGGDTLRLAESGEGFCGEAGRILDIAELPPSNALPSGRLVAGAFNGMGYSSDGDTFTCSSFQGRFRYGIERVEVAADASHPFGGTVYAFLLDSTIGARTVRASEDGGETYEQRHVFGAEVDVGSIVKVTPIVLPDGSIVVGLTGFTRHPDGTGTNHIGGVVWSGDGARTWTLLTPEASGWAGDGVEDMELDRDGRLYVATRNGVWRSSGALPVASEASPEASGARLRITPNPASRTVRVALDLVSPEAANVTVYDARGREVYCEASGARGEHAWEVRTERWAAGVYVVRAEVGGEAITAHLTVAR
ncbi:T9SS type A sorting domain-containing protein [Rubricoccus marinus]|uniref:Uncharacterized protein n=1 Tax=Rubricoccus marinus TaxID=716817 RepID=A0A259TZ79_9BACT|nr:T9SS type A sorting domain-containing protein [Rubricoccus marinus]OZC03069.1 hypothetical protein BSZ36_08855 [Rubricoccus marinus]